MPGGRSTSYQDDFPARAKVLAERGALDRDIAQALGIGLSTFYEYRHKHPEFLDALKVGKDVADDAVEAALFRKATGYSFDSEKVFQFEGEPVRVDIVEHVPPSDTAAIFWLKNRRGDKWRDKQEVEHNVGGALADIIAERRAAVAKMNEGGDE